MSPICDRIGTGQRLSLSGADALGNRSPGQAAVVRRYAPGVREGPLPASAGSGKGVGPQAVRAGVSGVSRCGANERDRLTCGFVVVQRKHCDVLQDISVYANVYRRVE